MTSNLDHWAAQHPSIGGAPPVTKRKRRSPKLLALGIPVAFLSQCAPQCAPAPAPAPAPSDCHPDYVECLPIVGDLDCKDIGHAVHLRDPENDAYRLDGLNSAVGDGVGCE
jgi:hypothetical protein